MMEMEGFRERERKELKRDMCKMRRGSNSFLSNLA